MLSNFFQFSLGRLLLCIPNAVTLWNWGPCISQLGLTNRLGGLNNTDLFSHHSGDWEVQDQDVGKFGFRWGLVSWLIDSSLLIKGHSFVHKESRKMKTERERERERENTDVSYNDTNPMGARSHPYVFISLCFLRDPISKYSHIGC